MLLNRGEGGKPVQRVVIDPEMPADIADLFRRNGPLLYRFRTGRIPKAHDGARVPGALLGALGLSSLLTLGLTIITGMPMRFLAPLICLYLTILTIVYLIRKPSPADSVERALYRHSLQWQGRYLIREDFDYSASSDEAPRAPSSAPGTLAPSCGLGIRPVRKR
jgi:hypothetical protein